MSFNLLFKIKFLFSILLIVFVVIVKIYGLLLLSDLSLGFVFFVEEEMKMFFFMVLNEVMVMGFLYKGMLLSLSEIDMMLMLLVMVWFMLVSMFEVNFLLF